MIQVHADPLRFLFSGSASFCATLCLESLRNSLLDMEAHAADAQGAATRALAVLHVLGYAYAVSNDDSCHSLALAGGGAKRALAEDLAVEATVDDAVPDAPLAAAPVT